MSKPAKVGSYVTTTAPRANLAPDDYLRRRMRRLNANHKDLPGRDLQRVEGRLLHCAASTISRSTITGTWHEAPPSQWGKSITPASHPLSPWG